MKPNAISGRIIEILLDSKIIDEENAEVVKYGFELMILKAVFFIICILIGVVINKIIESILFAASFTLLRSYAGGYHAKTKIHCFIMSLLTIVSSLVFCKIAVTNDLIIYISSVVCAISCIVIWICAPVDTANKRLDEFEVKVYKKTTRIILVAEVVISLILIWFDLKSLFFSIIMSIIVELILITKGIVKNYICKD